MNSAVGADIVNVQPFMPDSLLPRSPGGMAPGAVLALAAHIALAFALTAAVDWRMRTPQVVSAELWAAVPQAAAPRVEETPAPVPAPAPPAPAPAPAPPPPKPAEPPARSDADIAIEQAQKRKLELEKRRLEAEQLQREADKQKKLLAEKAEREAKAERAEKAARAAKAEKAEKAEKAAKEAQLRREAEEREAKAAEVQLAQQREANLRRMMGQVAGSAPAGRGSANADAAPSQAYTGRLIALIRANTVFTGQVPGNPAAEVEVRAGASGSIISRRLVKSSGHKDWDEAVLRAIDRTGKLPHDSDGRVPPTILISFRPNE